MKRCSWVNLKNPSYVKYHDQEWGVAFHLDSYLFEMLVLESFQAGLSWECVLNKREDMRICFDNFDINKVANYGQDKIDELMNNPKLIRNRLKIQAAINNARIFIDIQKEWGTFDAYIWHFSDNLIIKNKDDYFTTTSDLSDKVSIDLKKRGMKFVGSTIIYSYLQAIGIVDDHELECDFS